MIAISGLSWKDDNDTWEITKKVKQQATVNQLATSSTMCTLCCKYVELAVWCTRTTDEETWKLT